MSERIERHEPVTSGAARSPDPGGAADVPAEVARATDVPAVVVRATEHADAWAAYLTAAQRLDAVRRGAASQQAQQAQTVQAARHELELVRRRLAVQRSAMPARGVPAAELSPTSAELAAAAQAVSGGPAAALAALRQARAVADHADSATVAPGGSGSAAWSPWLRNLLVYGPFAAVVLAVQIALYLVADAESLPGFALLCGLTMPLAAFGLGWLTVGLVFPGGPDRRTDRTPVLGAAVCFAPILVTCMGVGVLSILR